MTDAEKGRLKALKVVVFAPMEEAVRLLAVKALPVPTATRR
jgi:hypothetical protein